MSSVKYELQVVSVPPVLPTVILKSELARYIGCDVKTLWRSYLTRDLLTKWGYDYDQDVKSSPKLSIELTRQVFEHWNVDPLAWYSIVDPATLKGNNRNSAA